MKQELNEKQKLFVQHFIRKGSATQAAIDAGYSQRSAYSQASDLLRHPVIKQKIAEAQEEILSQARMKLINNLDHCIATIVNLTYSDKDNVRLNAASYLINKITSMYEKKDDGNQAGNNVEKIDFSIPADPVAASAAYQDMIRKARLPHLIGK